MSFNQRNQINNVLRNNHINKIQKTINSKKRNYGIDLLRIFSMINIINLHINRKIGVFKIDSNNIQFKNIWRLEAFSFFAVDCFGLISGIVGFNAYKFSNLIYLWFISLFYCVAISVSLVIENRIHFNFKSIFLSFFPFLLNLNWYFNAYFIMYLFLPFVNFGIKYINKKTFRNIIFFYVLIFSIYNTATSFFGKTQYNFLLNGYSSSWLTILYIIGSYFGKYLLENINKSSKAIKCFYLLNYIGFSFLSSEILFISKKIFLISYLSPTILFGALSLIIIFYTISITNSLIIKIIKFITPLVFSVTLFHCRLLSLKFNIVLLLFKSIKGENYNFFKIYLVSILVFLFCITIDFMRSKLFKALKIREISLFIEHSFPKVFDILFQLIKFYF